MAAKVEAKLAEEVLNKKAAVIDDAFDDVQANEINLISFREYYQEAEEDLEPVLNRLSIDLPQVSDFDEDHDAYLSFLKLLWSKKDDSDLRAIIDHPKLFHDKLMRLYELTTVCENLKEQQIDVVTYPSTITISDEFRNHQFGYIFIDFNLGIIPGEEAKQRAKDVVNAIYRQYPDNEKPLAILMSSIPNISEQSKKFREDSEWIEGVFKAARKSDLSSKHKVSLLAKAYEKAYSYSKNVQTYIQTLISASAKAQEEFQNEVKMLSIEDYEFIQSSVLSKEKQPLGDYLAWLYGSRWTSLLHKDAELKTQQDIIDKSFSSASPLLHSIMPSEKLADIFMTALFEHNLGALKKHPLGGVEDIESLIYFHLGDLLTKAKSDTVYMIINPQCDLERPTSAKKDYSIVLLPGKLVPLNEDNDQNAVKTDFFLFEEQRYKIHWKMQQVHTEPYKKMEEWIKTNKLKRNFRLRLPYALNLQQLFTSNMSRVGLPVSPPMTNELAITVIYKEPGGAHLVLLDENTNYGFLQFGKKERPVVRLTLDFATDLKGVMIEKLNELQATLDSSEQKPRPLSNLVQHLEKFCQDFDKWFLDYSGFKYPNVDNAENIKQPILSAVWDTFDNNKIQTTFYISIRSTTSKEAELGAIQPEKKNSSEKPLGDQMKKKQRTSRAVKKILTKVGFGQTKNTKKKK